MTHPLDKSTHAANVGLSHWFYLEGINPEPWTSPTASVGRGKGRVYARMIKSRTLETYQQAVRETLLERYPTLCPTAEPIELEFYLTRERVRYTNAAGRKAQRNAADATNMQKALEDALQGVLFENDRQVRRITTQVIEQEPDIEPRILIRMTKCASEATAHWTQRIVEWASPQAETFGVFAFDDFALEEIVP